MRADKYRAALVDCLAARLAGGTARLPAGGELIFSWFADLSSTRAPGPAAITYGEIEAYARLHRLPLDERHIDLILALDRAWLAVARDQTGARPTGPPLAKAPALATAAFDAVFG